MRNGFISRTLDDKNFRRPPHSLCCQLWIGELRILAAKIFFDHPTGSPTSLSNKDWDFQLHHFRQGLTERRPANRRHTIGNGCAHEHRGISRQLDANFISGLA
jgi:hypothetical protein